ncbi:MAG: tetratricopeptide repeat protein, partial [Nitrospinota bacterium]
AVSYKDFIYITGGGLTTSKMGTLSSSEFTQVAPDGTLKPWRFTSNLNGKRVYGSGILHRGWFYVIGGERGIVHDDLLNTVERAKINPEGGLGEWVLEKSVMKTPRRAPVSFILSGRLYVSGGYNGVFLTDVESAEILNDGSLGPFRNESADTRFERYIHSAVVRKGRVFVFGGHMPKPPGAINKVEWTSLNPEDGYLEVWKEGPDMPTRRFLNGAVLHRDTVYLVGGRNSVFLTGVEKITLSGGGAKDISSMKWKNDSSLTTPRDALSLVSVSNNVYAIGGNSFEGLLRSVERAVIRPGKPLGYWSGKKVHKKESPVSVDALSHFTMGKHFFTSGQAEMAVMEIEEAVRLAPDQAIWHNILGEIYLRVHDLARAETSFKNALALPEFKGSPAQFNLALSLHRQGKLQEATKAFLKVLKKDPGHIPARKNLATIYLDTRQFNKAVTQYERILSRDPSDTLIKGFLEYARQQLKK